jgi:hypothetical protein
LDLLNNLPQTARSDDEALLRLVHEAPEIDVKLAAIEAIAQEESAKRAMRELRDGDKRLYRAAKSRWEAITGKRKSTVRAHELRRARCSSRSSRPSIARWSSIVPGTRCRRSCSTPGCGMNSRR